MDDTISGCANTCKARFGDALETLRGKIEDDHEARGDTRFLSLAEDLEDEFEKFRVWARNIGVFANYKASLDYRLREAESVKIMILKLLRGLAKDLDHCKCFP